MKKIDIFAHCSPKKFIDAVAKVGKVATWTSISGDAPMVGGDALWNIDKRLEVMEHFDDYMQLLIPASNVIETKFGPQDAAYLMQTFNEATAEWVSKYPDKFAGAVATVALNNIEASLQEIDRAIKDLGCKGIMLHTPAFTQGASIKPLDAPEFWPIYESMSKYDLPTWIHPGGTTGVPIYQSEPRGKYGLFHIFGWPIESMMAMSRLIFSGVMAKYPNLKFIIHHCGSMIVPALASRIEDECASYGIGGASNWDENGVLKTKSAIEYYKMFYGDTALYGGPQSLELGLKFFGPEHVLFGTDCPFDRDGGRRFIQSTIEAINNMHVTESDKELIFEGNAKRILKLGT